MWALRRASTNYVRVQGLNIATFRACAGLGTLGSGTEEKSSSFNGQATNRWITSKTCYCASKPCCCAVKVANRFSIGTRGLSSQAGAKSGGEEEDSLEEGFSELEMPEASETTNVDIVDEDTTSDSESDVSSDEENHEEGLESELMADTEADSEAKTGEKGFKTRKPISDLCRLILNEPVPSVSEALDNYFADGKELNRSEIYDALRHLRRLKLFGKALQLSEWLDANNEFEFVERDYASRVDLIAKVRGLQKAENYADHVPKAYRQELVYRTLLANCVTTVNVKKAEEVFNKMKDLGFPMTTFVCNQLLLLYKRTDKKKITDVLLMMEKEDIKPTLFTYQVLIDTKGQANDTVGMEQIVETMKAEGVEPNSGVQATLAKHYAYCGHKEKAKAVLKEMEGSDLKKNRWLCSILLPIYADLGYADEVERIWKVCESKPRQRDYLAAMGAWGKLKNVEKAEAVFDKLKNSKKKLTSVHYSTMLRVYADNKMLNKGKELLKKMGDSHCHIGPMTWDSLVKLYVDAGEVEKADSVLQKASQQNQLRPLFSSYMVLLDKYAKRGDVHNAEKIFYRMRQAGYIARIRPFHALLQAYTNANTPAYGIRERMKADNVFPNKALAAQISMVDAFRKTSVSELLD